MYTSVHKVGKCGGNHSDALYYNGLTPCNITEIACSEPRRHRLGRRRVRKLVKRVEHDFELVICVTSAKKGARTQC